ncbi:nucleolar protein dao-5-like isoform X3 [Thunnus maccoyii]|uniref:nucleolar protein dao-5-like isoform X3 n=1 Tax=Thunnus maccoyii TaxID=8240 RepID=UPI001C4CFFD9|nr:nucleolar protein dao-5-like isoform X3 [Thunnus maccoyii]XP_042257488.1 nucleolar protein dao-5-like isoform X3 [Thunnus maccoyii]
MSLQVCHCGWSKVTTYQGLRIHQGRMGCTQRGVRGAGSEQQNMWGNVGLPNKQQNLWVDIYTSIKTDTTDCSSQTSLQVCHCGWTQVTTYQGLRTHQGKMGCTQRGVRGAESKQQNMWGSVGLYTSVKTETTAGCSSDKSLQVCHCGWKKETTYRGLRIHQGKMGCTPKGMRIPATEQHDWKNPLEDVNQKKLQPALKVIIKKEDVPSPPRIDVCTKSASLTAPIKEEYEASAIPHRSATLSSPQSAVVRPKKKKRKDQTSPQVNGSIRERPTIYPIPAVRAKEKTKNDQILLQVADRGAMTGYAAKAATIKEEPHTPFAIQQQPFQTATNSKSGHELHDSSSGVQVNRSVRERPTLPPRPTVVPPKKKEGEDQTPSQVNRSIRERPTIYPIPAVRAKEKTKNDQILSQVNRSVRERPTLPPRPTVVPPKKEGKDQTPSQVCAAKAIQERLKSELELKIQMREEKLQKKAAEKVCESVPDSTSATTQTNTAAADAISEEDPKSLNETAQDSDFSTGMKVKQLALMFSATTKKTAAVQQPKEKPQEEQKLPQAKPLVQRFLDATAQETAVQQPKEKHEKEQKLPQPLAQKFLAATAQETAVQPKKQDKEDQKLSPMPDSTSATTKMNPAVTEDATKEDPKALSETAQLSDCSTGLKVKQLAWMFSATNQETAAQLKEKHQEEHKPAQVKPLGQKLLKPLAQKFLAATAQETAVQPKKQDREDQKLSLMPDSASATTKMNPAAAEATRKDDPKASCETAQLCDFSTGLKVKQLAWMFSDTTHKTAVRPKEKHNEERKPAQMREEKMSNIRAAERACESVPDSTSATTQTDTAAADAVTEEDPKSLSETAQVSDFSTGMKVKQLALMFSATTKKTAAVQQPKEKHQEEQKLPQAKPLAQKFLAATAQETAVQQPKEKHEEEQKLPQPLAQKFLAATAQETAVQPKKQDREDQKLSPMPDSTSATTKMNPAAAEAARTEDPKSSCETAQLCDFSTELKVPDTTSATTKMNPAVTEDATKEDPKALSETAQLSDCSTGLKVKQLAWMFSATNQETAAQLKEKHQEERKPAQVKPLGQKLSAATAQETAKGKERDDQKLSQVRQDRIPDDVKHMVEMRERNGDEDRSSVKACKPLQESLDCRPVETNSELSKVMEDACQKSLDLKISNETLRNTKLIKVGQIHQKLEKPYSNDLEWITKFAVDIKLDPTTAHRCLISADGKEVRDEQETDVADAPERFDLCGSVLGLNKFTSWKSYWEVEVSNKTGWDLGVARGDANRKGKLLLRPDDGYWAIVHFKNKEYAALTAPPVPLLFKENLQKVGVFVDYEGGLVSFYNVTAKSHIYSFTLCSFTGEICPYFSLHLGESADPLIISTVKHQ